MRRTTAALLLAATLFAVGCDDTRDNTPTYSWTFVNESSYQIAVGPNGQSWATFVLFPGDRRTVTLEQNSIYYLWWSDQGAHIYVTDCIDSTWYFRNK